MGGIRGHGTVILPTQHTPDHGGKVMHWLIVEGDEPMPGDFLDHWPLDVLWS